jgi:hypothetical protein
VHNVFRVGVTLNHDQPIVRQTQELDHSLEKKQFAFLILIHFLKNIILNLNHLGPNISYEWLLIIVHHGEREEATVDSLEKK